LIGAGPAVLAVDPSVVAVGGVDVARALEWLAEEQLVDSDNANRQVTVHRFP
jgi:hypothetical protein